MTHEIISKLTVKTSASIYQPFWQDHHRGEQLEKLFRSNSIERALKFTALFAVLSKLGPPFQMSFVETVVPAWFWKKNAKFSYVPICGPVPIRMEQEEHYFQARFETTCSYPGTTDFLVLFAVLSKDLPHTDLASQDFTPPPDLQVSRFTLCHPYLKAEMHDDDGIYLFNS